MIRNILISVSKFIRGEVPISKLEKNGLKVGKNFYRAGGGMIDPSCPYLIEIGDNVTFARGVVLLAHDASLKQHLGVVKLGKIKIGNNVFVGAGTTILCGVSIGDNSIIGAGSVVTRDVPNNMVYAGNPSNCVCTLEEYLTKHGKKIKKQPYYDFEYRFGEQSIRHRIDMSKDLDIHKYGYGETFDRKEGINGKKSNN